MQFIFCQWTETESQWTCAQCGAVVDKSVVANKPIAACRVGAERNGVPFREVALAASSSLRPSLPRYATSGPGTELKKLLSRFGFTVTPGCKCNQRSLIMNQWGCDECERRIDEIVGWMKEEADSRGIPFVSVAARMIVAKAIKSARNQP